MIEPSTTSGPDPGSANARGEGDAEARRRLSDAAALTRALVGGVGRGGSSATASAMEAIEGRARRVCARVVQRALDQPHPVADEASLAQALSARQPLVGKATAAALGARLARRLGPARLLARRSPAWLAASAAPAVYASIARGLEELALIASHLVHRARAAGVEPDPDRVRRVTVQIASRRPVRPDDEPGHGPLVAHWARRAVRAAMPFSPGAVTRDPHGVAGAAASVDVAALGRAAEPGPDM
jgi:hypothetical protein